MGCAHGHAIAECPDRRCQGGENTPDTIADWLASTWAGSQVATGSALAEKIEAQLDEACPECTHPMLLHAGGVHDRCAGEMYSGGEVCKVCVG